MAVVDSASNCLIFQNTAKKYKTSTGEYHRFIPNVPQEFDCRVKANIKPESKHIDLTIKNEEFKTFYSNDYPWKIVLAGQYPRPPELDGIKYVRTVEEKLIAEPVRPMEFPLSEMKDSFQLEYIKPNEEEVKAPTKVAECYVTKKGCEQQPSIPVNRKGFWKWTDPYLTSYRSQFVSNDQVNDIIQAEILTFNNKWKYDMPPTSGNKTLFDRTVFKKVLPVRLQSGAQLRVPNFGMQSEYQGNYISQTFSTLHSILQNSCTEFDDSLAPASSWQTLVPPGMYCSEYCNIGRKSVRSTVEPNPPKKHIVRTENCCRLY